MNRGDIVQMLEHEAKRFPIVADLLSRAATLTDAEIDGAQVPLKWYKDALRLARGRYAYERAAAEVARLAAENPVTVSLPGENEKMGLTLEYTGDNFWAQANRGFQIEIRSGDWLFFPQDGSGAWLNQTFIPHPPAQFKQSRKVAEQTRQDYILAYAEKLSRLPVADAPAPHGRATSSGASFTIQRL